MTAENEEEAEVFRAFFASVFKSQISYPGGSLSPGLEVCAGEQNEPLVIRDETVRAYCSAT